MFQLNAQPAEIVTSVGVLLQDMPNTRESHNDVIALSIASMKPYGETRQAFESAGFNPTAETPHDMFQMAAAKLGNGMTAIPCDLGGTLGSALRKSHPASRYVLRTAGGYPFPLIGKNPIGESSGRTRIKSAHLITPFTHADIAWHEPLDVNPPKYRGQVQESYNLHQSACGRFQILESEDGEIELIEQRYIWKLLASFDSVGDAKQHVADMTV